MLIELDVQGLGVIEGSQVDLPAGSTALTGETGAGKTLVVAALGLLRGGRAERSMVRQGAERAVVEGRFQVGESSPVADHLRGLDLIGEPEDGKVEVILSRSVAPDGRAGRCRINGSMVPLAQLGSVGALLIEIAGQNEHGRVAARPVQRALLDSFAEASELAVELGEMVRSARAADAESEKWRESERARAREIDILSFEIREIEKVGVVVGEIDSLTTEARRLENAEAIDSALSSASALLRDERGAEDKLGSAETELRSAAAHDSSLAPLVKRLESLRIEVGDIANEIADLGRASSGGEGLEEVQARLSSLAHLRRKFGETEEQILGHLEESQARLRGLRAAEDRAAELDRVSKDAWHKASKIAARLTAARNEAAPRLAEAVQDRLADLALGGAVFQVELARVPLGEHGAEEVSFLVSANPGERPKPVGKIASGGELSRISLALHLLSRPDAASTLVFDEVDAGVGGEAAQSIGRALAEVGRKTGAQVLVVTHLPQVAAFADNHLKVEKETTGGSTRARVRPIRGDDRILELSRMLAGLPESELGQEHARELLAVAGGGASTA